MKRFLKDFAPSLIAIALITVLVYLAKVAPTIT